jgi:hypothetical protein
LVPPIAGTWLPLAWAETFGILNHVFSHNVGGSIQTPSFSEAIAALEVLDGKAMLAFVAYFPMAFDFDV